MRQFTINALDIQAVNRAFEAVRDELAKISTATGSTSASSAQIASLQAQLDSLRAQVGAITGDVGAHASHHIAAGSDPVQIDEAQVTNLVSDLAGKASLAHASTHASGGSDPVQIDEAQVTNLVSDLAAKEATANKGAANGYAPLDASAKVPVSNLPAGLPPGAHASTHASGGSDPVAGLAGIFSEILVASATSLTVAVGEQMGRFGRALINGTLTNNGLVVCYGEMLISDEFINNSESIIRI